MEMEDDPDKREGRDQGSKESKMNKKAEKERTITKKSSIVNVEARNMPEWLKQQKEPSGPIEVIPLDFNSLLSDTPCTKKRKVVKSQYTSQVNPKGEQELHITKLVIREFKKEPSDQEYQITTI